MSRIGRLHIPSGYYHVMERCLERRRIFNTNADKEDFLTRLEGALALRGALCLAWSVMSSTRRTETPAKYISISDSSLEAAFVTLGSAHRIGLRVQQVSKGFIV